MNEHGRPLRVVLLAYDGVDELDLFGAYVPLAKARDQCRFLEVLIIGGRPDVRGSSGVRFDVHADLRAIADAAILIIPGGRGVRAATGEPEYIHAIASAAAAGVALYTVCSGVFLLAAAGITQGRTLAVHAAKRAELVDAGGCQVADRLVRDGMICSIGGSPTRGVKGVDIGFQVLRDWIPDVLTAVTARLETVPPPHPRQSRCSSTVTSLVDSDV